MIQHGFDMYRVYLSTPGDLSREYDACHAAISEINSEEAMEKRVLLVTVGLREDAQIIGFRSAVSENVRACTYFIQVFQDDWGPRDLFRKLFLLAAECRDDASMPMRDVVVCLKDAPHETNAEILAFRAELAEHSDMRMFRYGNPDELRAQLTEVCEGWAQAAITSRTGAEAASGA